MRFEKKVVSIVLCLIMAFGTVAAGSNDITNFISVTDIKASAADSYSVGDIIKYGSYPQTDVTDELGDVLNSIDGTWQSYGYYSGNTDGEPTISDYMWYKDVTYKNYQYRGVMFDNNRPAETDEGFGRHPNYQQGNGYSIGETYWFRYDPIKWRVLDPSDGLVISETIIDSQPYDNNGDGNYHSCSLRQWLNEDFYNFAFSEEQKLIIQTTSIKAAPEGRINDKIFLPSREEIKNSNESTEDHYKAYCFKGSDYA